MNTEFQQLLEVYLSHELSAEQEDRFGELLKEPQNQLYLTALVDEQLGDESNYLPEEDQLGKRILERLLSKVDEPVHKRSYAIIRVLRLWRWAAAVLLVLGAGMYFWIAGSKKEPQPLLTETKVIAPGKTGAVLTLADGTQVLLDTVKNGLVAMQGGITAKVVNGMLLYEGNGGNDGKAGYNTMSVPKGRQYHLTLPDGTGVWLNAASSIRYPTVFDAKERRVTITGEAYFEVRKGAPFILNADNRAEVIVLGTHFNVNSYPNEKDIRTTLLEGAVKVGRGGESVILKPGQQAQVGNETRIADEVDIEKVMAWKQGLFNFEGASLHEVLRQLERWYDIEVEYEKTVPEIEFIGKMTKNISLNDLLVILERSNVHFRLEGRKLIVFP